MKSLLIIRHAKSSWDNPLQHDFDRPLNKRGNKDAPEMAMRLKEKGIAIDGFISSPANRALSTAIYFAETYGVDSGSILQKKELYHAPVKVFYDVITQVEDSCNTIAVFSHNPGITDFVNTLTNTRIDDMPTAGIFGIKAAINSWKDFSKGEKEFWFFDCPKA